MKVLSSSLTPLTKFIVPGMLLSFVPIVFVVAPTPTIGWILGSAYIAILVFSLWWVSPIKKVALLGDRLLISNYRREIEVPVSHIVRIEESRMNRTPNISLFFDPPTAFGRKVRIVVPVDFTGEEFDRIIGLLHCAIESKKQNA